MKRAALAIVAGIIVAASHVAQAQVTVSPIASPIASHAATRQDTQGKPSNYIAPDYARLYWEWLLTHGR